MTETRAEKAQRLVDEDRVAIFDIGPIHVSAMVKGDNGLYKTIVYASGNFFCACPWGHFKSGPVIPCAHALAVKLAALKESP